MNLRNIQTFGFMAVVFLATHLLGLYTAYQYIALGYKKTIPPISPNPYSAAGIFLGLVAVSTFIVFLIIKYLGWKPIKIFFAFVLFAGILPIFDLFLPAYASLGLTLGIIALRFLRPSIISHNLAIAISIAGVSAYLALTLNVLTVILILAGLSIYDLIAVFKTKHMIKLAKSMMRGGVPLSIVAPRALKVEEKEDKVYEVSQLGTGDVALPLVFSITVLVEYGMVSALIVSLSALAGLLIAFLWISKLKKPIPALPPISILSLIGFILALYI